MTSDAHLAIGASVAVAVAAIIVFGIPAHAGQAEEQPSAGEISVAGSASVQVAPDTLTVQVGVSTEERTAKEALESNAMLMDDVISAILEVGITEDEIGTAWFDLYPVYDSYDDGISYKRVLAGYSVTNTITVETEMLDSAADIVDQAVNAGANRVDDVYFSLSREVSSSMQRELVDAAVHDARERAEEMLEPLNLVITGTKSVSSMSPGSPYPFEFAESRLFAMADDGAPTRLFASDQTVTTTVHVTFLTGEGT